MFKLIYPYAYLDSVFDIDYEKLCDMGYKAIIFDIDSTLVPHGGDATAEIDELFGQIHKLGLKTLLLSNNSEERIQTFNQNINSLYIPMANKPYKPNYLKAIEMLEVSNDEVVLVGDQLFTDILGANLCGIKSILVKYLLHEHEYELAIGKKRKVEKFLLKFYKQRFPNITKMG